MSSIDNVINEFPNESNVSRKKAFFLKKITRYKNYTKKSCLLINNSFF